ncbi:PREDICTED: glutamic acid-rich protein-like [Ipomoea nil]|uniref:glutamic acid-rich protein-like n=1 Tax=Ipomoea nil TaxID=35883 RepID=UPI000900DDCB|nr:PREDICTED: glutamic acid-rich protein-like [Ipomoea nil]
MAKRPRKDKSSSAPKAKEPSLEQPEATPKVTITAPPVIEMKTPTSPQPEVVTKDVSHKTPQISSTEPVIIADSSEEEEAAQSTPVKATKSHFRPTIAKANEIMAKLAPLPESILLSKLKKKLASSQGEEMKRKESKKRKKRSKSTESSKKSLPQEPIQAEQLDMSLTQEPAVVDKEAQGSKPLNDHLSLPQEPGMPEETRGVIDGQITTVAEPTLPQEPTRTEQMAPILTQELVRVEEDETTPYLSSHLSLPQEPSQTAETREMTPLIKSDQKEAQPKPEVLPKSVIPESSQAIVSVLEAVPIPPLRDQLLRESIETNFQRVMQWQKWRTSPLRTFLEMFEEMKDEEEFALEWIGTQDVYEALRLETIKRVYSYKVTHRTLGKEKAPICIELNKPPLDPAFVEEMKEFRGLKDDEGKEIEHDDERTSENESREANSDSENDNEEPHVNEEDDKDEDEDDKSSDEQDDSHDDGGDEDDDDDDDEGKDNTNLANDGNSDYDSDSPIIVGLTRELPLTMLPPLEDTARDDNMDASL